MNPLEEQVGGDHYKTMDIQPVEFIHKNGIGYMEGCAIKYLCRWRVKGGVQDLEKAKHFIDLLIAMEAKMEDVKLECDFCKAAITPDNTWVIKRANGTFADTCEACYDAMRTRVLSVGRVSDSDNKD